MCPLAVPQPDSYDLALDDMIAVTPADEEKLTRALDREQNDAIQDERLDRGVGG